MLSRAAHSQSGMRRGRAGGQASGKRSHVPSSHFGPSVSALPVHQTRSDRRHETDTREADARQMQDSNSPYSAACSTLLLHFCGVSLIVRIAAVTVIVVAAVAAVAVDVIR